MKKRKKDIGKVLRSGNIVILLYCLLTTNIYAQEASIDSEITESQSDIDWQNLDDAMMSFGSNKEYQAAINSTVLELQRHYDKYFKKRSRLVKAFWDNYPRDNRHDQALYTFFSPHAEPIFISQVISDEVKKVLDSIPRKDFRKFKRLVPIDKKAYKHWRKMGDSMVTSVLNSNVSLDRKEAAAFQLISRELRYSRMLNFPLKKEELESDYWNRFEIHYWQNIRLLLENHVNKYATLEIVASRVQNILDILKNFSISASTEYWQYFYDISGNDNPKADQSGIKTLRNLARENISAINTLKEVEYPKPIDMKFTAMDGTIVDLAKLRGKVVLIDFWATYCGPCIKEMPHVRTLYDKYKDQGFEVIGIAADGDENRERIKSIIEKTGANWPQRLDQGSDATVSFHALYKIKRLPTVWLLNKEGILVDTNAHGEKLESLIRKYLSLEQL